MHNYVHVFSTSRWVQDWFCVEGPALSLYKNQFRFNATDSEWVTLDLYLFNSAQLDVGLFDNGSGRNARIIL
ncbi:hypothetical protein RRG08_004154 [Elysia crispata]|uniref:Uncharacterized protein n=1 Tax=Elysia crispata TaxID=231223 RepID=A0AAE0YW37_9GAST|nr:hypothetical protein RRG08_004154 [Elysia crispata]